MTPIQTVWAALPLLTRDELDQIITRVSALRSLGPGEKLGAREDPDTTVVLGVIYDVLRAEGLVVMPADMRGTTGYSSFARKVPDVMAYLRKNITNRTQQAALLRVGVDLIRRYLVKSGIPAGTRTLMAHVHRIPEVIEQQFPGYAAAGMLHWIARREVPK